MAAMSSGGPAESVCTGKKQKRTRQKKVPRPVPLFHPSRARVGGVSEQTAPAPTATGRMLLQSGRLACAPGAVTRSECLSRDHSLPHLHPVLYVALVTPARTLCAFGLAMNSSRSRATADSRQGVGA